jgi:TusA-related sulfurtransferase
MTKTETSRPKIIDIEELGFDRGAHLIIKHALASVPKGESLGICGRAPELAIHLRAWCRSQGYKVIWSEQKGDERSVDELATTSPLIAWIVRDAAFAGRWRGAVRAGAPDPQEPGAVVEQPPGSWGLAARGARVEAGGPEFHFPLSFKAEV